MSEKDIAAIVVSRCVIEANRQLVAIESILRAGDFFPAQESLQVVATCADMRKALDDLLRVALTERGMSEEEQNAAIDKVLERDDDSTR